MPQIGNIDIDQLGADVRQGTTSGVKVQCADGNFTAGNLPKFLGDGTLTDSGIAAGGTRQAFVSYFLAGQPAAGATVYLPVPGNMTTVQIPSNFTGAAGGCATNPTAAVVYTFYKNGTSFGTASISTAGAFTWATTGGAESFTPGTDVLSWSAPGTQDATLANVYFAVPLTVS